MDIDECAEGAALCDQQCVNKDPRDSGLQYACKCRSGYSIDIEDKHKCIPEVGAVPGSKCRPAPLHAILSGRGLSHGTVAEMLSVELALTSS